MSMSKYQTQSKDMVAYLGKGVGYLAQFMRDLRSSYDETKDDVKFIKEKLLPSAEQANAQIGATITKAESMVKDIDRELVQNVDKLKKSRDEVDRLQIELKQLEAKRRGLEDSLRYAQDHVNTKRYQKQMAEEALDNARDRLDEGYEERRKAQLAAKIMWAIPFYGWIGAAVATVVDCTALKQSVEGREHNYDSANSEYNDSKNALNNAKHRVSDANREMRSVEYRKRNKQSKVKNLNWIVEELKRCQKVIVELNEDAKKLARFFGDFYGKVKVLAFETKDGYSIDILQPPAIKVIKSLSILMQRDIMRANCGSSDTIWKNLQAMEAITWPAVFDTELI